MGYVVGNQYGVISVRDAATLNEPKEIRFITSEYKELFKVPDGGQVLLCFPDGKKEARTCKYIDDYHLLLGRNAYHICELAERFRANGITVEPFPEKRMIWSDINLNLEDWIDDLRQEYPDLDEDDLTVKMYEINADYLGDERANLNIQCSTDIIVFGDIGTWQGRVEGYKFVKSGNIKDCLYAEHDLAEWYVDRDGEFCSRQIHHDGTNYLYFRQFKRSVSYDEKQELFDKFYDGKATQEDIDRVTDKLGDKIAEVYGWSFPTEIKERVTTREER